MFRIQTKRTTVRLAAAMMGTALAAATVLLIGGPVGAAAGDPTFETPTGNPGTVGSVGFFDSTGNQIYTGTVSADPIAAYFVASGGGINTGDHIATAYTYTPQDNKPADQWTTPYQLTGGDEFGATASAGYPGSLKNSTKAIAIGVAGGASVNDGTTAFPLASTNDPGILQIRILTGQNASKYYSTDIKITGTTWAQVFPAPPVAHKATSTTLTSTPNPSTAGQSVTLTATELASDSTHPAGSVQFKDGSTNLGAAVAVNASGVATATTSTLSTGSHSITAVFTATAAGYNGSTSSPVSQVVNAVVAAVGTTTALAVSPASPVITGTSTTLTATVTAADSSNAVGSVQFLDGTTNIGAPVAVASGTASTSTTFSIATHSITAKFVPTNTANYTGSTSAAASYTVTAQPATTTTTALNVTPASPVVQGTVVTLTGTVSPNNAPGKIQFYDGSTAFGAPVTLSSGSGSLMTSLGNQLSVGTHSLTAKFVPTDSAAFGTSTSAATSFVVTAPPKTTTIAVTLQPSATVVVGTSVSVKATLTPSTAVGTVQFKDGSSALGAPVTVSGGTATYTDSTLAIGSHSLTAVFTPTDAGAYVASTSPAVTLTVKPAPVTTTTTLTVTPAGPVDAGTSITLAAAVSGSSPVGSVTFSDGSTVLGTIAVSGGAASYSTSTLASGSHSLSATFVPTDPTNFAGSTSATSTLVVNAQATTTVLTTAPTTKVSSGTAVTLTGTLTPAGAVGSVEFFDGSTSLGSAAVSGGKAVKSVSTLTVADHQLTAVFTPTSTVAFTGSTSAAVALTVKAAATLGDVTVGGTVLTDGATLKAGDDVTLTGAGFEPGESVQVVLRSAPVVLATTTAAEDGSVTVTVTLPSNLSAGNHTLTLVGSLDAPAFAFKVAAASASATPTATPTDPATTPAPTGTSNQPGGLASTGATVIPVAVGAMLLVLLGFGLLGASRRRRTH
jgi:hypothetical protein